MDYKLVDINVQIINILFVNGLIITTKSENTELKSEMVVTRGQREGERKIQDVGYIPHFIKGIIQQQYLQRQGR